MLEAEAKCCRDRCPSCSRLGVSPLYLAAWQASSDTSEDGGPRGLSTFRVPRTRILAPDQSSLRVPRAQGKTSQHWSCSCASPKPAGFRCRESKRPVDSQPYRFESQYGCWLKG